MNRRGFVNSDYCYWRYGGIATSGRRVCQCNKDIFHVWVRGMEYNLSVCHDWFLQKVNKRLLACKDRSEARIGAIYDLACETFGYHFIDGLHPLEFRKIRDVYKDIFLWDSAYLNLNGNVAIGLFFYVKVSRHYYAKYLASDVIKYISRQGFKTLRNENFYYRFFEAFSELNHEILNQMIARRCTKKKAIECKKIIKKMNAYNLASPDELDLIYLELLSEMLNVMSTCKK